MSDALVFLWGTSNNKGPCVFCVKPYVKDVWSANLLPGTGSISSIAVTCHRKYKYIAISQMHGSSRVWGRMNWYEGALDRRGAEMPKTLFPLVVWMARLPLPMQQRQWETTMATLQKKRPTVPAWHRIDWKPPKQRYLLRHSFVGDNKDAKDPSPEAQAASEYDMATL